MNSAQACSSSSVVTCAVCLCELPGDPSRWETPNCRHMFCTKCILSWVKESNSCPLCRKQVLRERNRTAESSQGRRGTPNTVVSPFEGVGLPVNDCMRYAGAVFVLSLLARFLLSQVITWLLVICIPLYFMAAATLPPDSAFEAKKELKRAMRRDHLQEDHPEKPKGWFAKTAARMAASIGVEIASVAGYTQDMYQYYGVVKLAIITLDMTKRRFYWIGLFNKYHFIGSRTEA